MGIQDSYCRKIICGQSCGIPLAIAPVRYREKEIGRGDRQINRTSERGSLSKIFRENTKTFLNVILCHIQDDIQDSNVGRYGIVI